VTFIEKIKNFIREEKLIQNGDQILVGVSGGPDSIVLLHVLKTFTQEMNLKLVVVHLNHSLRGEHSDNDERFTRNFTRKCGLLFYSVKIDVKAFAKKYHLSLEEAGREARFQTFQKLISRLHFHKIALGHHADDQAETVLMNLVRGSGLRGLSGIQPKRDAIIRPLLNVSRDEIEQYAKKSNIQSIEDVSNKNPGFLRNRVRWNILKEIEKDFGFNGAPGICRTANIVREAKDYLSASGYEAMANVSIEKNCDEIILDINEFLSYFKAVQKMVLLQIFSEFIPHRRLQSQEINGILQFIEKGESGKRWMMGDDLTVNRSHNSVAFQKKKPLFEPIEIRTGKSILIEALNICLKTEIVTNNKEVYTKSKLQELTDYDQIEEPLAIRTMLPGDWFYPLGMRKKRKKLHDFFIDEKIPQYQRQRVPLLISNGRIVWIMGYRIDDRFKVTDETRQILKMRISKIAKGSQ